MTEFKIIFLAQLLAIFFLAGVALGSLAGHEVVRIVKVMPEQVYPEYIMKQASKYHGVPVAKKEEGGDWIGIDKNGKPFKWFGEVGE